MPETPVYPPRVQATILAYEAGVERGRAQQPIVTEAEVAEELRFDFWRTLMGDTVDDRATAPGVVEVVR